MITSRRDYILRIIDEVGRILARVVFKRRNHADQEALEAVVHGFERLFNRPAHEVFQFNPDQHFEMLTRDEAAEDARDKVLLYAALSAEAGAIYAKLGNRPLARATQLTALRFSLRALTRYPRENLPAFAPDIAALRAAVADESPDEEIATLLRELSLG
jgi:hypothetical protein